MKFGQQETPFMTMEQHVIGNKIVYIDYPINMTEVMRGIFR